MARQTDSTSDPDRAPQPAPAVEAVRGPRWGFARVRGISMEPTLTAGDLVFVAYRGRRKPGRIAVLRLPDGTVAIKRLTSQERDGWWFERDNPRVGVDAWSVGAAPENAVLAVARARVWPRPRWLRGVRVCEHGASG